MCVKVWILLLTKRLAVPLVNRHCLLALLLISLIDRTKPMLLRSKAPPLSQTLELVKEPQTPDARKAMEKHGHPNSTALVLLMFARTPPLVQLMLLGILN